MKTPVSLTPLQRRQSLLLIVLFVITRALALAAGMRYVTSETVDGWQFLDLDVLRNHLLRGLLNLHEQPPLFNAIIGLSEKIAGSHYGLLMLAFQMLLGMSGILCVYVILTQLQIKSSYGFLISLILLLNPAAVAFEFDALYTEVVYAFNCFLGLAVLIYLKTRSDRVLYCVIGLAVALTLVRSTYHCIWLVGLLAVLWLQLPENRRQIQKAGVIGLFVALLWPTKNLVLFHHFASTTWGPYSIASHWSFLAGRQPEKDWIAQGKLPTFIYFADDLDGNFRHWLSDRWKAPATGDPELDDIAKRNGGSVNWNSLAMLRMHDERAKDVAFLLRHDLKNYTFSVFTAVDTYFRPSSDYLAKQSFPEANVQFAHIAPVDRMVRRICCNVIGLPEYSHATLDPGRHVTLKQRLQRTCFGALLVGFLVLCCLLSFLSPAFWQGQRDRRILMMVLTLTMAYIFMVVNVVEIGENMRFRFETQAVAITVACVFLQQLADRRKKLVPSMDRSILT